MTTAKKQAIIQSAIDQALLNQQTTAIGIMDFDGLTQTCQALHTAFPPPFQHTFAVKANALIAVLKHLRQCQLGAEVASSGELAAALAAGYTPEQIIFDSPAKTLTDLTACISKHIALNLDNLQELSRVDQLMTKYPDSQSIIGFRINPQIGSGEISSTSTATSTSKFGYGLADGNNRDALIELYLARPWLQSIHTHTGSQGCSLSLMVKGIAVIVELAETINQRAGFQQITHLDIGGGLPVNFQSETITPTFAEYAEILKKQVPLLFSGKYQVKTEFGRAIAAKNGVIITRVEYTKNMGGRHIAITHAGAQIATRTAFLPAAWPLRVTGFSSNGTQRSENTDTILTTDIAGPCCFAGDLITTAAKLPTLYPNDYVMVHDTGAYYFSNHFDYNSLPKIAVYAASEAENSLQLAAIRPAETIDEVIASMQ